ncbi:antibiotic biosynthesis monooxygenase [Brevundimonas diminuta]|uniref:putative quinol monooxygenase n=1 Tax=Brevundimonas diminuta TaxID=293 RepID=UPI0020982F60|nr:putative quinol monooxygenase [Brevundimonas diminuta]MCO8020030.1 antibiotic biosynthesis monooxygenase [Brevundimonas diminuta]MCO8022835.1 antibiotic biosynthesis monooxygenase [Brevundimonas diminuta]
MLKVIAEDFIKPEHIDTVRPLYAELVRLTRREPLCLAYDLFEDHNQPGHFVFIEEWPDQAALDARQTRPGTYIMMKSVLAKSADQAASSASASTVTP